ncbi:MAG: hypothetical protein ACRYG7_30685 [Janthinobacterium lividum]
MFELFTFALLQFITLTGQPATKVGGTGWGGDYTGAQTITPAKVGGTGWGGDYTSSSVGGTGWGGDYTGN